jgi:hypothetical protein
LPRNADTDSSARRKKRPIAETALGGRFPNTQNLRTWSGTGNYYDNAMVETFFKTLKSERVWRTILYTRQEADQANGRYIDDSIIPSGSVRKNGRRMKANPSPLKRRESRRDLSR